MALLGNKKEKTYDTGDLKVPVSLGVIMDGNGRWATNRHLPRSAGHKVGAENLKELCRNCVRYGVKYLTVYAFSTENWARPQPEVDFLMKLFVVLVGLGDDLLELVDGLGGTDAGHHVFALGVHEELAEEGIRVRFTGDDSELPKRVREVCKTAEERSKNRPNMQLIVALNYGGRGEIIEAVNKILADMEFINSGMADQIGANVDNMEIPTENLRMAMCVVAAGPMMCIFPFFQKYFVKGVMIGAVKG